MKTLAVLATLFFSGICCVESSLLFATNEWNYLKSPDYDNGFLPNGTVLTWYIQAIERKKFVLLETMDFNIVGPDSCTFDYLKIVEGGAVSRRFCQNSGPILKSTGQSLALSLYTGTHPQGRGFRLRYRQANDTQEPTSYGCDQRVDLLGSAPKFLVSPRFPDYIPNETVCSWTILAPLGVRIRIRAVSAKLPDCSLYLAVFEGGGAMEAVKLCQPRRIDFVTIHDTVEVHLRNSAGAKGKFNLSVEASLEIPSVHGNCPLRTLGGRKLRVTNEPRVLASKNYNFSNYESNMDCMWILQAVSPNHVVHLKVADSVIQHSTLCTSDFAVAHNGEDTSYPVLREWCGGQHDFDIYSTGRFITLRFKTDGVVQRRGFFILYKEIPGMVVGLSKATLYVSTSLAGIVITIAFVLGLCKIRRCRDIRERQALMTSPRRRPNRQTPATSGRRTRNLDPRKHQPRYRPRVQTYGQSWCPRSRTLRSRSLPDTPSTRRASSGSRPSCGTCALGYSPCSSSLSSSLPNVSTCAERSLESSQESFPMRTLRRSGPERDGGHGGTGHRLAEEADHRLERERIYRPNKETDYRSTEEPGHRSTEGADYRLERERIYRPGRESGYRSTEEPGHRSAEGAGYQQTEERIYQPASGRVHRPVRQSGHRSAEETDHWSAEKSDYRSPRERGSRPANMSRSPPAKESDLPPAKDSLRRPAKGSDLRAAEEGDSRPAKESDFRPAKERSSGSAKESDLRAAEEGISRPAQESDSPPGRGRAKRTKRGEREGEEGSPDSKEAMEETRL